jgi:hypothetical protein
MVFPLPAAVPACKYLSERMGVSVSGVDGYYFLRLLCLCLR